MVKGLASAAKRREAGLFVAEGAKTVCDLMGAFPIEMLFATDAWLGDNPELAALPQSVQATARELSRMSNMVTPPPVIGVFRLPDDELTPTELSGQLVLVLDRIQDPGNLGTMIRTADWMGVRHIVCSPDTADCFGPKVVQATMGSLARTHVHYTPLEPLLEHMLAEGRTVAGTFIGGEDIYAASLPQDTLLVIGNEGRGISDALLPCISRRVTIPPYNAGESHGESLNAAIAAAICMAAIRYH